MQMMMMKMMLNGAAPTNWGEADDSSDEDEPTVEKEPETDFAWGSA